MSFFEPKDLCIGELYRLTEFVDGKEVVATGNPNYFLVLMEENRRDPRFPILGFHRVKEYKAEVLLVQAHAQFGSPTWRRAFRKGKGLEVYWPLGTMTWNHSWVVVEKVSK